VMSLELNLVKQRVQHLVRMMASTMVLRLQMDCHLANCLGRNCPKEIRLEK